MDFSLEEKNALVCGSSQGIGFASAVALANLGATVTLFARNEDRLAAALNKLPIPSDQDHDWMVADFDNVPEVSRVVEEKLRAGTTYQILVNNSGGPPGGTISEARENEFIIAFSRHVLSSHAITHRLLPGMRSSGYGRIINIISTSAKEPIGGLGVSNTIRGAVASWAKSLAGELASEGITVNNVLPGATHTGRLESLLRNRSQLSGESVEFHSDLYKVAIPMGRFADPGEIAAAVAFLASPDASYITGINIPVDGGRTKSL